jgi:hypothetical protein
MTRARCKLGGVLVVVLAACTALAPPGRAQDSAPAETLDLVGTWHVLVHYTDDNTTHPDQLRWHDRLWVFAHENGKLVWTEYPIVVFGSEEGRFEGLGTGSAHRVLGGWLPNEMQLANIRAGLRTNTRGMKAKKLRGSDAEGWTTISRARAASASVITYQEIWSVEFVDGLPHFRQEDLMGSARTEDLAGVTHYMLQERTAGGVFSGRYERDGTRHGTVMMRRAGDRKRLEEKDQGERMREVMRRETERGEVEPAPDDGAGSAPDFDLIRDRDEARGD